MLELKFYEVPEIMKYRLLAIDIDGTLLDAHRRITPRVRKAVCAANKAGCIVTRQRVDGTAMQEWSRMTLALMCP